MARGDSVVGKDHSYVSHVLDRRAAAQTHERGDRARVQTAHQPSHQIENMPSVIEQYSTAARRAEPPLAACAGADAGGSGAQTVERDVTNLAQPFRFDKFMRKSISGRVLPVMHAHQ